MISIIVPIYNVEKYLKKCLDSIINQTYKNLEIILVDDGSTDCSGKIADEYGKKDKRIKVIHKKNGGVSSARNVGIDNASGKYIAFVDSDDWIDLRMYEILHNIIKKDNYNIAICNIAIENEEGKEINKFNSSKTVLDNKTFLKSIYYDRSIQGYSCNKLYERKLLDSGNVRFDEKAIVLEDDLFNVEIACFNKKMDIIYNDMRLYHYVEHASSVSNSSFNIKKMSYFYIRNLEIKLLEKYDFECNYLKVDYCAAFIRSKYLIKYYKLKINKIYIEANNNFKEYKKQIELSNLSFLLKIKYFIVKFMPIIYYIKIKKEISGGGV